MCVGDIIGLVKDVTVTVAAGIGAYVAIRGLSAWRVQLKGHTEYDLARRLLITLFKYRDAINGVRHPAMWAHEMPAPPAEEAAKMDQDEIRFYGTSKAYQARADKVQTERGALYADLIEAEALWGTELRDLFGELFKLEHELFAYIRNYLTLINPKTSDVEKRVIDKHLKKKRDVMYDTFSEDDEDEYRRDFKNAMAGIERYLKPKLSHAGV